MLLHPGKYLYEFAAQDGPAPKWQKLFPIGKRYRADFPKGVEFSADTLKSMISVWESEGKPQRPVDYFHRGAAFKPGPVDEKVAAGWIQDLQLRDDGLYALINWTERARGYIKNDELRYLSPEFSMAGTDKLTGKPHGPKLISAALLNDPFLSDLPRVAATEEPAVSFPHSADHTETHLKNLIAILKLAETATEADVEAAVKALAESAAAVTVKMSESATKMSELEAVTVKLTADLTAAQGEAKELKAAAAKLEVHAFVEKLVLAGKVAPAIRESVTKLGESNGLEAIKFFENAPQVIEPKKEIGVSGSTSAADTVKLAEKRISDRTAELMSKGMKYGDADQAVRVELAEDFALVFGGNSKHLTEPVGVAV